MFDDSIQQRDSVLCMQNHTIETIERLLANATQYILMFGSKQDMSGVLFEHAEILIKFLPL